MGLHKNIESAEKLEEYFNTYELQTKSNPFLVQDYVGKDGDEVYRKKEKPLTMEGFECWLYEKGIISDLSHYFSNKDNRYSEFVAICSHIRKRIRQDQISGGMAGLYNPSITQRLNGLTDKSEMTVKEQPLFPDEI